MKPKQKNKMIEKMYDSKDSYYNMLESNKRSGIQKILNHHSGITDEMLEEAERLTNFQKQPSIEVSEKSIDIVTGYEGVVEKHMDQKGFWDKMTAHSTSFNWTTNARNSFCNNNVKSQHMVKRRRLSSGIDLENLEDIQLPQSRYTSNFPSRKQSVTQQRQRGTTSNSIQSGAQIIKNNSVIDQFNQADRVKKEM